ncbi:MAG TPA: hypothetical protein VG405_07305 [Solirubrobacteraceae bacterium]|jgi:hypothetical protein|nr:hypothetical protein [Solirubrobacteraceae bacterium]
MGFNGGQLLYLAIGGCISNDLRELAVYVDEIAEIRNSIRSGAPVKLSGVGILPA